MTQSKPEPGATWQMLSPPDTEWRVKIRTKDGRIGGSKDTEKFDHRDACE